MNRRMNVWAVLGMSLWIWSAHAADSVERTMDVRQGPETVFDQPVERLFVELEGARATNSNGRVGNELVFWGYSLADGRDVYLFACAMLPNVDCDARREAICPAGGGNTLARSETQGKVRQMTCRSVTIDGPGSTRPGCEDRERDRTLAVGLIQCN